MFILTHQIGQYVMTLPQQLEPFTSQDNPMLDKAMETGRLPYPPEPGMCHSILWERPVLMVQ